MRLQEKQKINDSDNYKVKNTQEICFSIRKSPKEHPSDPLEGENPKVGNADSGTPGNRRGKKAGRLKSASESTKQTSKTDSAKSRGWSKKRGGKATYSSQMSGAWPNKMRSSS